MCSIVISHYLEHPEEYALTIKGRTVVLTTDDMATLSNLTRAALTDTSGKTFAYYDENGKGVEDEMVYQGCNTQHHRRAADRMGD